MIPKFVCQHFFINFTITNIKIFHAVYILFSAFNKINFNLILSKKSNCVSFGFLYAKSVSTFFSFSLKETSVVLQCKRQV
jgi:hypothetical protein